jgi:hypothetical protein
MEINIDVRRLDLVLDRLMEAYWAKQYPYNLPKAHPPHIRENLPKNLKYGSIEHANFLFCLCYQMRGGIGSETATKKLALLYENFPIIFQPEMGRKLCPYWLSVILQDHGLGFNSEENSRFWVDNFDHLARYWNGNLIQLFDGVNSFDEACLRIRWKGIGKKIEEKFRGFFGFQHKMVSMLLQFFIDSGLIPYFPFHPPIDFHFQRLMINNRIVTLNGGNGEYHAKKTEDIIRDLLFNYITRKSVNSIELDNALWLLSGILCKRNPGNTSQIGERHARSTKIKAKEVDWTSARKKTFRKTCWSCPINSTCEVNVPAAYRYIKGKMKERGERPKPPQKFFEFEDWPSE